MFENFQYILFVEFDYARYTFIENLTGISDPESGYKTIDELLKILRP